MDLDHNIKTRLLQLLDRAEQLLPPSIPSDFKPGVYNWLRSQTGIGHLLAVPRWQPPEIDTLWGLDEEITQLRQNTLTHLNGGTANHTLLTGPRGCGKTTLVHGVLGQFLPDGLTIIRVAKQHLGDMPLLTAELRRRGIKVVIACDELSYSNSDAAHLDAKNALDELDEGSLIYATSNRRHLISERHEENLAAEIDGNGELHPGETTDEKLSLSDRFGLWIPVFEPSQEEYLEMVSAWLRKHRLPRINAAFKQAALQWARERGSMNGRIARMYVRDYLVRRS